MTDRGDLTPEDLDAFVQAWADAAAAIREAYRAAAIEEQQDSE